MKYSDYLKLALLSAIDELADNPSLYARNPGRDFTRNRKLGFKQFLIMLLSMEGDCIKEELYRFFGRSTDAPSKAAFYKQRQKLREDALRNLLFVFNAKLKRRLLSFLKAFKQHLRKYHISHIPLDHASKTLKLNE